jgi:hypothetical protein
MMISSAAANSVRMGPVKANAAFITTPSMDVSERTAGMAKLFAIKYLLVCANLAATIVQQSPGHLIGRVKASRKLACLAGRNLTLARCLTTDLVGADKFQRFRSCIFTRRRKASSFNSLGQDILRACIPYHFGFIKNDA